MIDGLLPQIQMTLLGGHLVLPTVLVKVALAASLFISTLWQWSKIRLTPFLFLWLVAAFYLAADVPFLFYHENVSPLDVLIGYNAYYALFLMAPLAIFLAGELSEASAYRVLGAIFWVCFLMGAIQYLTHRPILHTESTDGSFQVLAWEAVDGSVRVFSFFTSALGYGTFCCLVAALAAARLLNGNRSGNYLAMLLGSILACYTTLTRNCYTQILFSLVVVFCLSRPSLRRWIRYTPFIFLILAMIIAVAGVTSSDSDSALTSNLSTLMRLAEWKYYTDTYRAATHVQQLFGMGIIQNTNASNDVLFPIDSEFLAVLMQVGLVGVILIFWLQWKIWIWVYERACTSGSPFAIAIAAFWSTFLAVYFYNTSISAFSLVFLLAMLVRATTGEEAISGLVPYPELSPQPL